MTRVRGTPCMSMVGQPIRLPFKILSDEFRRYRAAPVVAKVRALSFSNEC